MPSDVLVIIFQRGACDGLSFVPPLSGEDRKIYEQERPNIKLAVEGPDAVLPLDHRFGLHPKAKSLYEIYQQKRMAIIHAVGSPLNSRSHFDAQNLMELGLIENRISATGWLSRFIHKMNPPLSELPAVAAGPFLPTSLLGYDRSISVNDLGRLNLAGIKPLQEKQQALLASLYQDGSNFLFSAGQVALSSLTKLQKAIATEPSTPLSTPLSTGAVYPKTEIGGRLKTLSQLIKINLGLRVASVDMGGWDTHKYQGAGLEGPFAKQVEQLSEAVGVFYKDVQTHATVRILIMTEFGRRLRENANRGTDHGHGGVFFVIGSDIQGGQVLGQWPGLKTEQLFDRADLAVTTDYRQVISELILKQNPQTDIREIFPIFKMGTDSRALKF